MGETPHSSGEICASCTAVVTDRYCATCGEKQLSANDFSMTRILGEALRSVFNLDSKLWLSFRTLITRPGKLTRDYIDGQRKPYLGPFQLFLIASILFYIVMGDYDVFMVPSQWFFHGGQNGLWFDIPSLVTLKAEAKGLSEAELALVYDAKITGYSKLFLIFAIPFLALTTYLAQRRKSPEFGKHVIFATHNFTFVILWLMVFIIFNIVVDILLSKLLSTGLPKASVFITTAIVVMTYFTLAVRRVWDEPLWKASLVAFAALVVLVLFMIGYRSGVSYLTLKWL